MSLREPGARYRVLIVDDEPDVRLLLGESLAAAGFEIMEAEHGEAGLAQLVGERPDVVLLDVRMPGRDGFQICAEMRQRPEGRDIPIIMVTALDDLTSIQRAFEAGANDFMTKPITWSLVSHRVRYTVRASELANDLRESRRRLAEAQRIARVGHVEYSLADPSVCEWSSTALDLLGLAAPPLESALAHLDAALRLPAGRLSDFVGVDGLGGSCFQCEARITRQDGERTLQIRGEVVLDGPQPLVQITFQDLTERKRQEDTLRRAADVAQAASAAKTQFLASVSHELRTPLNAVLGFSKIFMDELFGPLGDERYREYAADIHGSGSHLLSLISQILDFAKVEAGKLELHETQVAPAELVDGAVCMLREQAAAKSIHVTVAALDDLPIVIGDQLRLRQVLLNLLSNAIKFTSAGGKIEVAATCEPNGRLRIDVVDTGIGIDAQHIRQVFEPFYQVEDAYRRSEQGTGLGLPLSRQLVELHGGTIELESTPGRGTCARIYLPASRVRPRPSAVAVA